jgi:LPXTG-motif cell wall-anchored protein
MDLLVDWSDVWDGLWPILLSILLIAGGVFIYRRRKPRL